MSTEILYPVAFDIKDIQQINASSDMHINIIFIDGSIATVRHIDFNHFTGSAVYYSDDNPFPSMPSEKH